MRIIRVPRKIELFEEMIKKRDFPAIIIIFNKMNISNKLTKGIGGTALAFAVLFAFSPMIFGSYASASRPSIKEVRGRQVQEIKLPIKYEKYASKRVKIKLYRTNQMTGEEMVTTHNRRLDSDGRVNLRVDELNPGTLYQFKVKIKRENGGNYSDKSKGRKGSTKYIGQS